ncbi:DUF5133 domain-containing protein [Streptomyces sp. NBC_01408]|uniref:DUF5133 domain-containing protein n=1 Tax=Streptomyces sp. NBC_01408 TaxID=2903855 RepID=UPI00224CB22C|nr:DUF5133 domain-containing protein [Streptomyces sp. NBC_01408]MCX4693291.1 DUF5133 domain-containing protein [Streptomyces sp. NBC_01408]
MIPTAAPDPAPPAAAEPSQDARQCATGDGTEDPAKAWALGRLMALTPCTAPAARQILAATAGTAGVTERQAAAALVGHSRGAPLPRRIERALGLAIRAARTPATEQTCALLPSLSRASDALGRFRTSRARLHAAPADPEARRALDDAAYTLCVLMGRRTAHEAVLAAEEYVAAPPVA